MYVCMYVSSQEFIFCKILIYLFFEAPYLEYNILVFCWVRIVFLTVTRYGFAWPVDWHCFLCTVNKDVDLSFRKYSVSDGDTVAFVHFKNISPFLNQRKTPPLPKKKTESGAHKMLSQKLEKYVILKYFTRFVNTISRGDRAQMIEHIPALSLSHCHTLCEHTCALSTDLSLTFTFLPFCNNGQFSSTNVHRGVIDK